MKGIFEIGALIVVLVIAAVLFEKYASQIAQAANAQSIAAANRSNAWTSLGLNAGNTAIGALSSWLPQPPYGGN